MEEKEYNVITLENGIEYTEVDKLIVDDTEYLILSNLDDPKDFCIRKLIVKDNEKYITGLDNDDEFDKVYKQLQDKYK